MLYLIVPVDFVPFYSYLNRPTFRNTIISVFKTLQNITAQKIKFSIMDFSSKCDQIRKKNADLVRFTGEILNGKLHFLHKTFKMELFAKIGLAVNYFYKNSNLYV